MKIKSLSIFNIRNHLHTDLELAKLNFFVGQNNAGKSGLLAAIEWVLTGKCQWTDRGGRGAAELISQGQREAAVTMEVEGVGSILRTMPPHSLRLGSFQGKNAQGAILNQLGTDEERLSSTLNAGSFLSLPQADQRAYLFRAFGLQFTSNLVAQKLASWLRGNGYPEQQAEALAARVKGYYPPGFTGGPEVLEVMEKRAKEIRKDLKREKQRAEAALAELAEVGLDAAAVAQQIEQNKQQLKILRQRREELLGAVDQPQLVGRRQGLVQKIHSLEGRIQKAIAQRLELEERLQRLGPEDQWGRDSQQREQELQQVIQGLNARVTALQTQTAQLETRLATLYGAAHALASQERRCPLAPEYIPCGLSEQQVADLLEQLNGEYGTAQTELQASQARLAQLNAQIKEAQGELLQVKQQQERAKKGLLLKGELNTLQLLMDQFTTEKDDLAEELAALPEPPSAAQKTATVAELEQLADQMAAAEEKLVQAGEQVALQRRQEELQRELTMLSEETAAMEVLVKALGPSGVLPELLAGILDPFLGRANDRLARLTGGAYRLAMGPDMNLFCRVKSGAILPLKLLSKSEQLRVGIAIQEALSHAAGLSFLAIDEADMLDPENRQLLTALLLDIYDEYDQVLVFTTVGAGKPEPPLLEGVKLFWVEDGRVAEVH